MRRRGPPKGWSTPPSTRSLGQGDLAVDLEVSGNHRCTGIRLPSADADCVIALSNDRGAILGHHAQVTIFQFKMNFLAGARFEMDTLESAQGEERRTFHGRKFEIDLDDLVASDFAGVSNLHLDAEWLVRGDGLRGNGEVA